MDTTTRTGLHERLRRLHRLMRRRHVEARTHAGPLADTTRGRGWVLSALERQSPIPTRELAYLLAIRQQSLNELLKKLQADGLVERTPSETDGRVMMVALTEAGRDVEVGREDDDYLDALTDEEAAALVGLLDKLIDALETELGADDDDDPSDWMAEARRRMGDGPFEAMMRMREQGFGPGPFGGRGRGGHGGRGRGPHHGEHGHCFPGEGGSEDGGRRLRRRRGGPLPAWAGGFADPRRGF